MLQKLKSIKWGYVLTGIMIFIVGIAMIISATSSKAIPITLGIILAAYAAAGAIFFIITDKEKNTFLFGFKIISASLILICGIIVAILNERATSFIISLVALFLLADGAFKLTTAAKAKKYEVGGWWIMLFAALITLFGSFILLRLFTEDRISIITILFGAVSLLDSGANIISVYFVEEYEKNRDERIFKSAYKKFRDVESSHEKREEF